MKDTETHENAPEDDMLAEIDFSKGTRGKFFKPGVAPNLPVYLEAEVQAYLQVGQALKLHQRGNPLG